MEIRNLITFTKVAETQSLSKAAKALGYAQSTVTMQMQQLEQELGTQLYERVGKQICITQTGQEFLSYAAAIVRMSEEALTVGKQTDSTVTGSLRLGVLSPLSGACVSGQISWYLQEYPQVKLQVDSIQKPEQLLSMLRHNEIDLALTLGPRQTDGDLVHATEDLAAPVHLYVGKEHPLAGHPAPSAKELSLYPLICTGYFDAGPECSDLAISRQMHISDPELALFIAADQGNDIWQSRHTDAIRGTASDHTDTPGLNAMVLMPDLIVRQHPAAGQLVPLDCQVSGPDCWLQILCHRNKWLTRAMKAWLSGPANS